MRASHLLFELFPEGFKALVDEIVALGYVHATAGHYAALIGDTPCFDEAGMIVVQENDGRELARLRLKFYESVARKCVPRRKK